MIQEKGCILSWKEIAFENCCNLISRLGFYQNSLTIIRCSRQSMVHCPDVDNYIFTGKLSYDFPVANLNFDVVHDFFHLGFLLSGDASNLTLTLIKLLSYFLLYHCSVQICCKTDSCFDPGSSSFRVFLFPWLHFVACSLIKEIFGFGHSGFTVLERYH